MKLDTSFCKWAVVYAIDGKYMDDGKTATKVTAIFDFPHLAEDFIEKCLPKETRERFRIEHIDPDPPCQNRRL